MCGCTYAHGCVCVCAYPFSCVCVCVRMCVCVKLSVCPSLRPLTCATATSSSSSATPSSAATAAPTAAATAAAAASTGRLHRVPDRHLYLVEAGAVADVQVASIQSERQTGDPRGTTRTRENLSPRRYLWGRN